VVASGIVAAVGPTNPTGRRLAKKAHAAHEYCRLTWVSTADDSLTQTIGPSKSDKGQEDPMIKKVKKGYKVLSEKGKSLGGPYKTKEEAEKRLRQVEFFKHRKG
jgi:hypothetical protein